MAKAKQKTHGAVIVTRVSTGEQAKHGTSLEGQLEACRHKAVVLSLPIVAEYEDAGVSGGFLLLREGMQAALADIEAGRASHLICASVSRFSRNVEHQQALLKKVRVAGGEVVFCDMAFDDTPEGDLMFNFIGGYAAYEKAVIRKRTMGGKRRKAEEGRQPCRTFAPYGYHITSNADVLRGDYPASDLGKYTIQEPAATQVRDMFNWYAEGRFSLAGMAKYFNQQGIPPPRGGRLWRDTAIRVILTNPAYKGEAMFGRHKKRLDESRVGQPSAVTGKPLTSPHRHELCDDFMTIPCPPIVSEELWDAVQARTKTNLTSQCGNPRRIMMLSGLVYCPNCGGGMVFKSARHRKNASAVEGQFCCSNHIKKQRLEGVDFCDAKTYRQSDTEGAVLTALRQIVQYPEVLREAIKVYHEANAIPQSGTDCRKELQAVARRLEQLEQEQQTIIKAQIAGITAGASPDAYSQTFADLAARRRDLENRRTALTKASKAEKSAGISQKEDASLETVLHDLNKVLTSQFISNGEKRVLVGRVVEKVTCQKGGADVIFLPGLLGEVGDSQAVRETPHRTLTACASYLGL